LGLISSNIIINNYEHIVGLYTGEYQKHAWVYVGEIPCPLPSKQSTPTQGTVEVRDYWYRTYTYRYYGYIDTTEVVVELTHIFL